MSLGGGNKSNRPVNPLHAMDASRQCVSLTGYQWIATGYALAMTSWLLRIQMYWL
ncbi:MAG: hypothetical protein P8P49_07415 [Opitutales bacterium]|nr:hypothetical protein [Opitutales bacterium]